MVFDMGFSLISKEHLANFIVDISWNVSSRNRIPRLKPLTKIVNYMKDRYSIYRILDLQVSKKLFPGIVVSS